MYDPTLSVVDARAMLRLVQALNELRDRPAEAAAKLVVELSRLARASRAGIDRWGGERDAGSDWGSYFFGYDAVGLRVLAEYSSHPDWVSPLEVALRESREPDPVFWLARDPLPPLPESSQKLFQEYRAALAVGDVLAFRSGGLCEPGRMGWVFLERHSADATFSQREFAIARAMSESLRTFRAMR